MSNCIAVAVGYLFVVIQLIVVMYRSRRMFRNCESLEAIAPWIAKLFSLSLLVIFLPGVSSADVVLTFDHNPISNAQVLDQAYGDRVTGSTDSNGHMYDIIGGNGLGLTPNVEVSYGGAPRLWDTANTYANLNNVFYNTDGNTLNLQLTLTADPGFEVGLFGFDAGASTGAGTGVQGLSVSDGNGNELWSFGTTLINGAASPHDSFDFSGGLFANSLTLEIELDNAGFVSTVAVDNIHFGQRAVPEPSGLSFLLVGALGLMVCRKRPHKNAKRI